MPQRVQPMRGRCAQGGCTHPPPDIGLWGAEAVRSDDDMDSPDLPRHHVIRENHHRIHDPFSEEKLAILGGALRLSEGDRILDLACGSGEMLCTWSRDYGITGTGVDISSAFIANGAAR